MDATGAGGRPEGFAPTVGTKFRLVARPKPGWNGVVDCEVLAVDEAALLRYSWTGDEGGDVTQVAYRLDPHAGGTRFTYEHTGFTGIGGFFMAQLLGSVRRKMLGVGLPRLLEDLDEDGVLRPTSALRPKPLGSAGELNFPVHKHVDDLCKNACGPVNTMGIRARILRRSRIHGSVTRTNVIHISVCENS